MKTPLLPSERNGFMKIACTSGNMECVPGLNSQTKTWTTKIDHTETVTEPDWEISLGSLAPTQLTRHEGLWIIWRCPRSARTADSCWAALWRSFISVLRHSSSEKNIPSPLTGKRQMIHQSDPFWLLGGLWEILFCHQQASNKCLANVTTNLRRSVFCWAAGWC